MAKLEIPLNMNPSLTAALEKVSAYAGRLEVERKDLVDKLNHAESVIHDLTGDKELLKSELERSRDMANYFHGQLYSMNEYCLKNGFEFIQNNPALTMIHEMEKLRSQVKEIRAEAGRAGFVAGYFHYKNYGFQFEEELKLASDNYAAKVRNAGTWLRDENVNGGKRQGGER